ncbi:hypothetical protein ACXHJ2_16605 [Paenibacillus sp. ALE3]
MSVKDMTDQQLNKELSLIEMQQLGWKLVRDSGPWIKPDGSYSTGRYRNYCSNLAASLEVQAKALEIDTDTYIRHLGALICDRAADHYNIYSIAKLLNASPRQRAEAAYMTLSSHPLREDI